MPLQFGMYQNQVQPDIRGGLDAFKSGLQIAGALGDIRASRQQRQEMQALQALMADPANFDQATGQLNYQKLLPEVARTAPGQFQSFSKLASEQQSAGLQAKKQQLDMLMTATKFKRDSMMRVMTNPTVQNANQVLDEWSRLTGDDSSDEKAAVAGMTPDQIKRWAVGHAAEARDMEKLMPQFKLESFGGFRQAVSIDPLTGQPITAGEQMPMTATPGERMTDARARAQQAEQRRQFGIREQRLGTEIGAGKSKPPFPGGPAIGKGAGSQTTEDERKAAAFTNRMDESTRLLDKFEAQGKPSVLSTAAGGLPFVGGLAQRGAMTKEQQQYKNAADAWIRAKLRKESGAVIAKDEMEQEYATYFPQLGDTPELVAQKAQLRLIANQEMKAMAGRALPQRIEVQEKPSKPTGKGWQAAGYSSASDAYQDFKSARDHAFKAGNYDLVRQIEAEARNDGVIK